MKAAFFHISQTNHCFPTAELEFRHIYISKNVSIFKVILTFLRCPNDSIRILKKCIKHKTHLDFTVVTEIFLYPKRPCRCLEFPLKTEEKPFLKNKKNFLQRKRQNYYFWAKYYRK